MKKAFLSLALILFLAVPSAVLAFPAVEVYKNTSRAVVLIIAQKDRKSSMIGAGSIISPSGYVVTNAHVVIDKSTGRPYSRIRIFIKPEKLTGDFRKDLVNRYDASVTAHDTDLDLAVLKIEGFHADTGLIELADVSEINIGEEVVAIGHPEQGGLWSLTYGRISGEIANQSGIPGKDVFQTDTSVNRGNSGGPLLDRRGYMVGINTNIARLGAGNLPITGVNFAVKSSVVKKWLEKNGFMIAYGKKPLYYSAENRPEEKKAVSAKPVKKEVSASAAPEGSAPSAEKPEKPPVAEKEPPVTVEKKAEVKGAHAGKKEKNMKKPEAADRDEMKAESGGGGMALLEDRILTPKRPYKIDDLFREVEKELEDMMEEMKWKIRSK